MDALTNSLTPGIFYLLTLVFGFLVSKKGKPYNVPLFNVHKLLALGSVILVIIQLSKLSLSIESQALLVSLLFLSGVWVIALFVTGALMSIGKPDYKTVLTLHRIMIVALAIFIALSVYQISEIW